MAKSNTRQTADVAHVVGRKNLIINGGFDVWQRGTSFTPSSGSVSFTADRWGYYTNGGTTRAAAKVSEIVNGEMRDVLKATIVGATNADTRFLRQPIENLKQFSGKTLTLSFWAKASVAIDYRLERREKYGTGGSSNVDIVFDTVSITTSWQKFTSTFTVGDLSAKTFGPDNTSNLLLMWKQIGIPADHDLYISDVQCELGSVATDFEHRSYGEELALCQRYYHFMKIANGNEFAGIVDGYYTGGNYMTRHFLFPVTMRTTPSVTNMSMGSTSNCNSFSVNCYEPYGLMVNGRAINTGRAYYYFNGWTADAEL